VPCLSGQPDAPPLGDNVGEDGELVPEEPDGGVLPEPGEAQERVRRREGGGPAARGVGGVWVFGGGRG